jgi:cytochrome c biogenesis protein
MAQDVRTGALAAGTDNGDERTLGGIDVVLEKLWHTLTSMRFAIIVLLGFALVGVLGALIIQAPPGVTADVQAKADWIDSIRPKILPGVELLQSIPAAGALVPTVRYGDVAGAFETLQLFTVFNSVWFKAIVVLLTTSLVACSVQRIPGLWKVSMHPHVDVGSAFFEHAPQHETAVTRRTPAEIEDALKAVFKKHHYRYVSMDDGIVHAYGDKHRFTGFASLAAHLSLVLILVGVIIGAMFGFRDGQFMIAEGQTVAVPSLEGTTVKLEAFRDSYYAETGAPSDYASDLVVYENGQEVKRQTVRVNDPLRIGDVSFYQSFYGPAAQMVVKDAGGKEVVSEGVPLAWSTDDGARKVGTFTIPSAGLSAWVVGTAGSEDPLVKPGQMRIELYQANGGGTPIAQETIDQGKPTVINDLTFTFERETQFTGLSVAKDPGVMIVWLGCLLLMGGFVVVFMLPHRRIWARIVSETGGRTTVALASAGRKDVTQGTEFADIVVDVRAALAAPRQA